ncbi:hypothetical protein [Nonomuraea sp. NPDC046570]|uniref:hypothetical protein n=1 Tax=Nonomuraea sp. NPDC046570 TaxID=3155255 RepID=UPI0033C2D13C
MTYSNRPPVYAERSRSFGFVVDDVAWARSHGYGRDLPGGGQGCVEKARRGLYPDYATWSKVSADLTPLYAAKVTADPRYRNTVREWADCMREEGLPYSSPARIRAALPALTRGKAPEQAHALEVRLATAEAGCAVGTTLAATVKALDLQHGAPVRKLYAARVETRNRLELAALPRARELLTPPLQETR